MKFLPEHLLFLPPGILSARLNLIFPEKKLEQAVVVACYVFFLPRAGKFNSALMGEKFIRIFKNNQ